MSQRSIRFPDDVEARVQEIADAEDRSFSYVVLRAVEAHLSNPAMQGNPRLPVGSLERYQSTLKEPRKTPTVSQTWAR